MALDGKRLEPRREPGRNSGTPARTTGLVLFGVGLIFVLVGLSLGVLGLPALAMGVYFAVSGGRTAFRGKSRSAAGTGRTSAQKFDPDAADHEHIRSAPITRAGEVFRMPRSSGFDPAARDHGHITAASTGHSADKRLEQLRIMKDAGLIDEEEYRKKLSEIK